MSHRSMLRIAPTPATNNSTAQTQSIHASVPVTLLANDYAAQALKRRKR